MPLTKNSLEKIMKGEEIEAKETITYEYDEIIGLTYKLVLNTDYYEKEGNQLRELCQFRL